MNTNLQEFKFDLTEKQKKIIQYAILTLMALRVFYYSFRAIYSYFMQKTTPIVFNRSLFDELLEIKIEDRAIIRLAFSSAQILIFGTFTYLLIMDKITSDDIKTGIYTSSIKKIKGKNNKKEKKIEVIIPEFLDLR